MTIAAGNHLYERCGDCGKWVRMTGWFARLHLCLTDEERASKEAVFGQQLAMDRNALALLDPIRRLQ